MARLKSRAAEAGLREYLLEGAVSFREVYGRLDPAFWAELSKPVDQLVGGESYGFARCELPDGHPVRREGGLCDFLVLTEADELNARAELDLSEVGEQRDVDLL